MNSKPKILFVSHEYSIGGSTVSLVSLIQGLKTENKIEAKVLLPHKRKGNVWKLLEANGIPYKTMWYRKNYKSKLDDYSFKFHIFDFMNLLVVKKLQHYIQKEKFDIVCSNSTGVDVGARAARMAKVPHIYYVREFMELDHNCEYRNKKRMRDLLGNSEYVIFISKAVEEFYKSNYILQNTVRFFNGFVLEDYYIEGHTIFTEEQISFVQVGAFSDGKGTINTIEMLHNLNQRGITNWKIEFIGNGREDYVKKMQEHIAKYHLESQVVIGEFCSDIKDKLSSKDILIMNSRTEGFGRVTVEGMLAGCLVVGRNQGGTKEIISDEINGVTYENDDDFILKIEKIVKDRNRYINLAKKGQQYALEQFDCSKTAQNFMEVVEQCLS